MPEDLTPIVQALMPHMLREMDRVRYDNVRFVHYTSAESGLKILHSNRMLLRNSALMNDFSEVSYGMNCLSAGWNSDSGARLKTLLRKVQADLPEIFEENFSTLLPDLQNDTYLISISEHGDVLEDAFGRLSMWRAYAPRNGVAFVFNNVPFVSESNSLNAFTSPVVYATPEQFTTYFDEVVSSVEEFAEAIVPLGGAVIHQLLMHAFRFAVQSTKHPAFKEEREWRVIYAPTLLEQSGELTPQQLERVPTEIMTLGGVPQRVYAIPFRNFPDEGFVGATIPELIERVLIGPSQDSYVIARAYVAELERLGVPDPHTKVAITGVPLRH